MTISAAVRFRPVPPARSEDAKLDGERTFPANDARKVRQRLSRERAEQFIVEHSTLTPPPTEPIVQKVESK